MQKTTKPTTAKQIQRFWHKIDVGDKILGRTATHIAVKLMGKNKPYFARNMDCGDYVVVTNASTVQVTGKKAKQKIYTSYSGYPGGLRKEAFEDLVKRKPEQVIRRAVSGMLPKNKLRDQLLKRLYVYEDSKHPFEDKFK